MLETILKSGFPKLLNSKQTAEVLGLKKTTLDLWRTTKRYNLKFIKVGSRVYYRSEDIHAFLRERTVGESE